MLKYGVQRHPEPFRDRGGVSQKIIKNINRYNYVILAA
jgi:hypothetical protein